MVNKIHLRPFLLRLINTLLIAGCLVFIWSQDLVVRGLQESLDITSLFPEVRGVGDLSYFTSATMSLQYI